MLKIKIFEYFDELVNKIDLKAERLLLGKQKLTNVQSEKINRERTELIEAIRNAEQYNYHHLNSLDRAHFENKTDSELYEIIFPKFTFLLDSDEAKIESQRTLGCIVLTDKFMTVSQVALYKELISNFSDKKTRLDSSKSLLISSKNNFFNLDQTSKVSRNYKL
jgi:hypothetical protein